MTGRILFMLVGLLLCAPSSALALTINGNGLTDTSANYACDVDPCLANKLLTLESPVLDATGTIEINEGAGTADINITLTTFTFVGDVGGIVDEVIFTNVNYMATVDITITGDEINQVGIASGSVSGFYQQLFGGIEVVANQFFSDTPLFQNFNCLVTAGTGQCASIVGLGAPSVLADFQLNVGGTDLEVVNTFNLIVVPEPSTGALLATALTFLGAATRRRGATRRN